ncbi:unnamed protein product [Enterobius vermicularis]|uniref:Mannosyl-glycoprotein endo-beta-N-acetylglucosaminidase n=1 Tax=Enterobius vermicularis TaxID=51028 RepID=A0A0N4UT49_ENTVE|nr:unnamed protein product [Enterobius vermicularis]
MTSPIDSLDGLWGWDANFVGKELCGRDLKHYSGNKGVPQTLVCHDMMGGYLPEESVDGCEVVDGIKPYILMHWWYVDIFTYFSHHFISIPPVGWISQAHDHGVLVLGTFITEGDRGADRCKAIFKNATTVRKTVEKMVKLATVYNFDGWLINIENKIEAENLPMLELFLATLTTRMHIRMGERSRVIWYDAVTVEGKLRWQDQLNDLNKLWFDVTDGIFLNYTWRPHELKESQEIAGSRCHEVFVGVDCFGRGNYGWNCYKAFAHARAANLSVAMFAPGWIAEQFQQSDLIPNSMNYEIKILELGKIMHSSYITLNQIPESLNKFFQFYNMLEAGTQPYYLESNAFPHASRPALVLPDTGNYK